MQGLQSEAQGIGIEGSPVSNRLDEIRNNLEKFTIDTKLALRKDSISVVDDDEITEIKPSKVARLLSTRYGRTCFDTIIAKTPDSACLHEVQLKFLSD